MFGASHRIPPVESTPLVEAHRSDTQPKPTQNTVNETCEEIFLKILATINVRSLDYWGHIHVRLNCYLGIVFNESFGFTADTTPMVSAMQLLHLHFLWGIGIMKTEWTKMKTFSNEIAGWCVGCVIGLTSIATEALVDIGLQFRLFKLKFINLYLRIDLYLFKIRSQRRIRKLQLEYLALRRLSGLEPTCSDSRGSAGHSANERIERGGANEIVNDRRDCHANVPSAFSSIER